MVSKSGELERAIKIVENNEMEHRRRQELREASRVRKAVVWAIFSFIVLAQVGFFIWYKKRRQNELAGRMRTAIDESIVEYMRVGVSEDTEVQGTSSNAGRSNTGGLGGATDNQTKQADSVDHAAPPGFNETNDD